MAKRVPVQPGQHKKPGVPKRPHVATSKDTARAHLQSRHPEHWRRLVELAEEAKKSPRRTVSAAQRKKVAGLATKLAVALDGVSLPDAPTPEDLRAFASSLTSARGQGPRPGSLAHALAHPRARLIAHVGVNAAGFGVRLTVTDTLAAAVASGREPPTRNAEKQAKLQALYKRCLTRVLRMLERHARAKPRKPVPEPLVDSKWFAERWSMTVADREADWKSRDHTAYFDVLRAQALARKPPG